MKNLLVVASKEYQEDNALLRAINWAKNFDIQITLIGFTHAEVGELQDLELSDLSRKELKQAMLDQRYQTLRKQVDETGYQGDIAIIIQWTKHIAPAIDAYCEKHHFDLLLKSAHQNKTIFYTPTDWKLMRSCPVPVMITANKSWKKKATVLASVDLKTSSAAKIELNHRIISAASNLAQLCGDELHLVYAIKLPQALIDMDLVDEEKYTNKLREKIQPTIDSLCKEYNISGENVHIKPGPPARIVPSIANSIKAELVFTGASARKGISAKLLGNVAEKILSKLRTDIVVIK
jgi:universal stress protein E